MVLQLFRKEIYLPFLLSISLFLIIDISFYNHIALGKNGDDDNRDSKDNNVKEEEKQEEEDFEDASLDELFDDNNDDDNRDSKDNNVKEEEEKEDEKEEENEVPFILPFNAVPFP
jgi:hypothetical protein